MSGIDLMERLGNSILPKLSHIPWDAEGYFSKISSVMITYVSWISMMRKGLAFKASKNNFVASKSGFFNFSNILMKYEDRFQKDYNHSSLSPFDIFYNIELHVHIQILLEWN